MGGAGRSLDHPVGWTDCIMREVALATSVFAASPYELPVVRIEIQTLNTLEVTCNPPTLALLAKAFMGRDDRPPGIICSLNHTHRNPDLNS